ncbi:MAG: SAM-dependent methyltransferase [Phormidesmis sp.]
MAMQLDQVVPFGRSLNEYVKMFSLSKADLQGSILGVADGPASFNAEGTELGYKIHSVDPLYAFKGDEIRDRFYAVLESVIAQVADTEDDYVWRYHRSPADLKAHRIQATERFYTDYEKGKAQGRYHTGELPQLSYPNDAFDLGLCSHFLFLYSLQYDADFHIAAVEEMLRLCQEVRIFPLLTLNLEKSPHLDPVVDHFKKSGYQCAIETVEYEFQRGGNKMLKIHQA